MESQSFLFISGSPVFLLVSWLTHADSFHEYNQVPVMSQNEDHHYRVHLHEHLKSTSLSSPFDASHSDKRYFQDGNILHRVEAESFLQHKSNQQHSSGCGSQGNVPQR